MNNARAVNKQHRVLLDLGTQPVSSHFRKLRNAKCKTLPIHLVQDIETGVIRLDPLPPPELLIHPNRSIAPKEPESHLDNLVKNILARRSFPNKPTVVGISEKDKSLVARFSNLGWDYWMLDSVADLGLSKKHFVESIPDALTEERARRIAEKRGRADLVVARHIWEHTAHHSMFAAGLKALLADDGLILLEVPDCLSMLELNDYTMIWEEHLFYFTHQTFLDSLKSVGLHPELSYQFTTNQEDISVALVCLSDSTTPSRSSIILQKILDLGLSYSDNFPRQKNRVHDLLDSFKRRGNIGIVGAGHLTVAFVNYLELSHLIDFALDDHPSKQGMFLPGTDIPISSPKSLQDRDISLLLVGINPPAPEKLIERLQCETSQVFDWFSIFPRGAKCLPIFSD